MALLPVEPQHAKLLLESQKMECHSEALTVVAAMSVDSLFYVPNSKREEAESAKKKFASLDGELCVNTNFTLTHSIIIIIIIISR